MVPKFVYDDANAAVLHFAEFLDFISWVPNSRAQRHQKWTSQAAGMSAPTM